MKLHITNSSILILSQLIFVTIIRAFPLTLTVTIKNYDEEITLNWQLTQHDLANHNLPLWYARLNSEPELIPNVMNKIGSFAMYHDIEKSSAVVYFLSAGYLTGVVDTRFIIHRLPLSSVGPNISLIVGGRYVKRRDEDFIFHDSFDFTRMFHRKSENSAQPSTSSGYNTDVNCQLSMSNKNLHMNANFVQTRHQKVNILYAEVLVFVSYDVVKKFGTFTDIVAHYLVHFNLVDMLYAKLTKYGIEIRINIAGLVLEGEKDVFPYVLIPGEFQQHQSNVLDAAATLHEFPKYLKQYENIFAEDTFDFFFISTYYTMQAENRFADGVARIDLDIYEYRTKGGYFGTKYDSIGILVHHKWQHGEFVTSAHELAHVFEVKHDSTGKGKYCFHLQCYAILQVYASYCKNCIVWSAESREQFQAYVSTNKNRCFLLNHPRSLYPRDIPIRTMGPTEQCACYGFESHWPANKGNYVDEDTCGMMLICAIKNSPVANPIPRPFDGTPCSTNKVCWRRQCRNLITSNG